MKEECISIVIPVFREQEEINPCLHALNELSDIRSAEVIIVDGDRGTTLEKIEPSTYRFYLKTIITKPGRGRQLHAGALQATCPALLFLHVDTRLPQTAIRVIKHSLAHYAVGAFDIYIASRSYLIRAISVIASFRSRISRIPYGDQAHFFRAETYFTVGGYPQIPIMEDVAIMGRLKRRGIRVNILKRYARNPDRRLRKEGATRSTLRNWYLRIRYAMGADASILADMYRPQSDM